MARKGRKSKKNRREATDNKFRFFMSLFLLLHMFGFGVSSFMMAYSQKAPPVAIHYLTGGLGVFLYTILYVHVFGRDEIKWLFINAALGIFGIYCQIDWLLSFFDKRFSDYPWYVHPIPFLYFVLYTFLIYHIVLTITKAKGNEKRKRLVENCYIVISVGVSVVFYFLGK